MSEQLKKFKLKWVKYEGWSWVGEEPVDAFVHECELVRAEDADALAARLAECEAALSFYAQRVNWNFSGMFDENGARWDFKPRSKDEVWVDEHKSIIQSDLTQHPETIHLRFGGKRAREYFEKWAGR